MINELNIQEYRKHLALVSQEPTLYAGTVRFNILLGAIKPEEEVTQEEIEDACRKANILEFIEGLPQYVYRRFNYFTFSEMFLAGASTLRSVARVLSYLVARNVRSLRFNHLR